MNKKLLIIGFVWPEPKSSAAGSRMMQLIQTFKSQDYNITFASACAKTDNAFDLTTIGVKQTSIELNDSGFDVFIKTLNPDIVLFDRFITEEQFGWRVAEHCPEAMRILDTEDLHCLRKGRHQALKENSGFNKSYLFNDIAKREIASIYRCDFSLIISEAEIEILKNDFKVDNSLLYYLPFLLDKVSSEITAKFPKFEKRQHFVTIGNFLHQPNYDAVLFLKQHIWPLIRKQLPEAELHVYGAYASQKVNQLHNQKEGFIIKGFAKDVNEIMKAAKVCVAPIRFGAGLKGKLVDAMQNGTPCIMSTIAAEGMFGNLNPNGFIVDSSEEFADKAVTLFINESLWKEKQKNGFSVINERFNKALHQNDFINSISNIKTMLKEHRLNNFTGQLLQHHLLQSTKFMSKWIEAKNRK
ncbi:glycosyltransferase family 4 protein [Ichthyenterobacterium magnum]|uniref:Glycosyl transferase family 1 n=1 Tax=Ichthyenterobacterium magnum TaxID=1230530 RepID=A0A420DL33_9FLAO|nr:glycosyltransferase family 4 protein [Ichthyenterobacterium magnum]RKE94974.1 glycosyl transferase family 1 [Ichthyenterobacterium magnum]